jgi:glycosyltransferase involved in cell wall biosynthesis
LKNIPLITIITVVFNNPKLLEKTILSVNSQTFKNKEYIIIDGNSGYKNIKILQKYNRFIDQWVTEPDRGIYDAMNKGIKKSNGKWIIFLNAGDKFYSKNILKDIFFKKKYNADLIYGDTVVIKNNNQYLKIAKKFSYLNFFFWSTRVVCHQSVFAKIKLLKQKFNIQYILKAELDWYFMVLKKTKKIMYLNKPVSKYLEGGLSSKNFYLENKETLKVLMKHNILLSILYLPILAYKVFNNILNIK